MWLGFSAQNTNDWLSLLSVSKTRILRGIATKTVNMWLVFHNCKMCGEGFTTAKCVVIVSQVLAVTAATVRR